MSEYTFADVRRVVEKIVAANPDEVYQKHSITSEGGTGFMTCVYSWNGEPDCIVGHVCKELDDYLFATLSEIEEGEIGSFGVDEFEEHGLDGVFDARTINFLTVLQAAQDGRYPWSEALIKAELSDSRYTGARASVDED